MKKLITLLILWGILVVFNDGQQVFFPEGKCFLSNEVGGGCTRGKNYFTIFGKGINIIAEIPAENVAYIKEQINNPIQPMFKEE